MLSFPTTRAIYDIFLIYGWLGIDIKWIMKKELGKNTGTGFWQQKGGTYLS